MSADSEQTPANPGAGVGIPVFVGIWSAVFALGAVTSVLLTAVCDAALPSTEADGMFGNLGRLLLVLAAGIVGSLVAATVVAVRARRRTRAGGSIGQEWRRLRMVAIPVLLSYLGLWAVAKGVDRWRYARTTDAVVGTWHLVSQGTPLFLETFHPDGTCDSLPLTGPARERVPRRSAYAISPDGRYISVYNLGEPQPRYGEEMGRRLIWEWHIEFTDRDHFRQWKMAWNDRGGYSYERAK